MKDNFGTEKVCPLNGCQCLKQTCALWIEIVKDAPNPSYVYEYKGCGLIAHLPWQPHKHEESAEQVKPVG